MITTILLANLFRYQTIASNNLVTNPLFDEQAVTKSSPKGYSLEGNSHWAYCGYSDETALRGVSLRSFDAKGSTTGSVSQVVQGIDQQKGKWLRFSFLGRAEEGFSVKSDQLFMKIDFLSKGGVSYIDSAKRLIYREIVKDRADFTANGDYGKRGSVVWRKYEFEELAPFPEVDAVRLSVGFESGNAAADAGSKFYVTQFSLQQSDHSVSGKVEPTAKPQGPSLASTDGLTPLGGRWFYRPAPGEKVPIDASGKFTAPLVVNSQNADRLYYRDDRLVNPFAENMSAWMRKGYMDAQGTILSEDKFVPDSVVITFDGSGAAKVFTRNIPNHQTAKFPDTVGTQGYNPSYIQEHADTYFLPLEPQVNPSAKSMTEHDANYALNMGAIGLAVNGVVFFNPFDAQMTDASSIMDRCCGHPSPDYRYHYHKYPICVNTPFVDKGENHSPVIGFAFDGLPVYGPYEAPGEMARDSKTNPLNAFNAHFDAVRGWHYHVTPGKYPYILGGYFGKVDSRNFVMRRR